MALSPSLLPQARHHSRHSRQWLSASGGYGHAPTPGFNPHRRDTSTTRITYMTTGDGRSSVPVLATAAPSADHAGGSRIRRCSSGVQRTVLGAATLTDDVGAPCLSVQPAPHARPVPSPSRVYLRRRSWQRRRRRETPSGEASVASNARRGGAPFSLLAVWHAYSAVRLPARRRAARRKRRPVATDAVRKHSSSAACNRSPRSS